jgi:hypothetical protein
VAVRAARALVVVSGVVLCTESAYRARLCLACSVVGSELLARMVLVSFSGGEVFCHLPGLV